MGNTNLKMYMKALWVNMLDEGTVPGTVHSNEFYEIIGTYIEWLSEVIVSPNILFEGFDDKIELHDKPFEDW